MSRRMGYQPLTLPCAEIVSFSTAFFSRSRCSFASSSRAFLSCSSFRRSRSPRRIYLAARPSPVGASWSVLRFSAISALRASIAMQESERRPWSLDDGGWSRTGRERSCLVLPFRDLPPIPGVRIRHHKLALTTTTNPTTPPIMSEDLSRYENATVFLKYYSRSPQQVHPANCGL